MSTHAGTGLARVTIAAPKRRIDVALPENVPLAELRPGLLRHAGEGVADDGEQHGDDTHRNGDDQQHADGSAHVRRSGIVDQVTSCACTISRSAAEKRGLQVVSVSVGRPVPSGSLPMTDVSVGCTTSWSATS